MATKYAKQTIVTRYHGPTNTQGARYTATSTSGLTVKIKEKPHWTKDNTGHFAALRALQKKIGNLWPDSPMIGGALNERGDMVWVFDDHHSPRSDQPPESLE